MRQRTLVGTLLLGERGTIRGGSFMSIHSQRLALLLSLQLASILPSY